ncbi:MAG: alpha/beta hydrolase, partial [Gemmatimonadota bacterium]
ELPDAPPQPWRNPSGEEGDGDWDELTDEETGRSVYVYKPLEWDAERTEPYPLLVGLGAFGHGIGMRVDRMLDELIGAGRLPPMLVALVDLTRDDEATNYRATADFILDELLPYLGERYGATTDARRIVVSGTSRRGMVAALLALDHPDIFGNVLSLSGSYYWRPADVEAFEWVPMRYAFEERRPVRFYVAAGELETFVSPGNRGHYLLATNRHMRDVLVARDYDLEYVEFNGVHSELNWQDWLAAGLVHLLGERP